MTSMFQKKCRNIQQIQCRHRFCLNYDHWQHNTLLSLKNLTISNLLSVATSIALWPVAFWAYNKYTETHYASLLIWISNGLMINCSQCKNSERILQLTISSLDFSAVCILLIISANGIKLFWAANFSFIERMSLEILLNVSVISWTSCLYSGKL